MATKPPVKSKKTAVAEKAARAAAPSTKADRPRENRRISLARFNNELSPNALLAEMIGTFILVSAVVFTSGDAFFSGLTYIVLAFALLAISGAHLNPAVTFGLWTLRKIPAVRMLAYWLAQFLGAIAAIVVTQLFSGLAYDFSLGSFGSFEPKIFFAELIGAAVLLFGFSAAVNRGQTDPAKAVGIGLSLFLGLVMATGLLSEAVKGEAQKSADSANASRLQKVNNVSLNPAVALAQKERDPGAGQSLSGEESNETPTLASRLTLESILGPLLGAAIGANLYSLLANRRRDEV